MNDLVSHFLAMISSRTFSRTAPDLISAAGSRAWYVSSQCKRPLPVHPTEVTSYVYASFEAFSIGYLRRVQRDMVCLPLWDFQLL